MTWRYCRECGEWYETSNTRIVEGETYCPNENHTYLIGSIPPGVGKINLGEFDRINRKHKCYREMREQAFEQDLIA
jgi:hypothetical protein